MDALLMELLLMDLLGVEMSKLLAVGVTEGLGESATVSEMVVGRVSLVLITSCVSLVADSEVEVVAS